MKNKSRDRRVIVAGFTLIELVVVAAIIGIMAGIILAYLTQARNKGADAAIKSNLASVRSQAEIYNSNNGNYGVLMGPENCPTVVGSTVMFDSDQVFIDAINATKKVNSGRDLTCVVGAQVGSEGASWAISSPMMVNLSKHWCVDSFGFSGETANPAAIDGSGDAVCP